MRSRVSDGVVRRFSTAACALLVVVGFLTTPAAAAAPTDRHFIGAQRPGSTAPLPFSEGVVVGDTLYIAGHIGLEPKTQQAPADAEQEARLVMDAVRKTVTDAGFQMSDVVSLEVFCTDLKLYDTFNTVYRTYFTGNFPARAFVGVKEILRGGHYEVLGIAVRAPK
jgi:2-iminobutanoate/2-iminopropanoate deaminase